MVLALLPQFASCTDYLCSYTLCSCFSHNLEQLSNLGLRLSIPRCFTPLCFFLFVSFPLLYQFLVVIVEIPFIVNKVSEVVATLQKTANKLANMTPSNFGLSSSSNPTSNFIIAPSTPSSSASNYTLSTFGPSTPSSTASCSALNNSGPSVQRSTPPSVQRSTPPSECDTFGFGVSICLFRNHSEFIPKLFECIDQTVDEGQDFHHKEKGCDEECRSHAESDLVSLISVQNCIMHNAFHVIA